MPRYNSRGKTRVYFALAIANRAAPTVAEINAGTALAPALRTFEGFTSEVEDLDNADFSSTWGKTLPGGETAADSSMTFAAGDVAGDVEESIRNALVQGANGFVVWCWWGAPTAGQRASVYPARIKSNNQMPKPENAIAEFQVGFSLYDPPSKYVALV